MGDLIWTLVLAAGVALLLGYGVAELDAWWERREQRRECCHTCPDCERWEES